MALGDFIQSIGTKKSLSDPGFGQLECITSHLDILAGKPTIRGMRTSVEQLLKLSRTQDL